MKNTENTMKFPPNKRLWMDIHDLNICNPLQTHSDSRQTPRETQHAATTDAIAIEMEQSRESAHLWNVKF